MATSTACWRQLRRNRNRKRGLIVLHPFTAGARDFLDEVPNPRIEKPFDPRRLRALINDWVR